jgi:hypothetical protein
VADKHVSTTYTGKKLGNALEDISNWQANKIPMGAPINNIQSRTIIDDSASEGISALATIAMVINLANQMPS